MEKEINTLTETIAKFRSKQYIYDFYVEDNFLKCRETNEKFAPEDVTIDRTERYEGDSNPEDMSVIYAITFPTDTKGILIDAFGTYSNPGISEFIRNVPVNENRTV